MRNAFWLLAALLALGLMSCRDNTTAPHPVPPAAPRGLFSITGDRSDTLVWLANTESGIAGYRVYVATCETCPYQRVGTTAGTWFVVTGLANGVTRYFAVAAVDAAGNESDLTYETISDTPRPEGVGATVVNFRGSSFGTGWVFKDALAYPAGDPRVDIVYSDTTVGGLVHSDFYAASTTDIQDLGYHTSLNAVDFAPWYGWSPTGSAEAIVGHCYVVWTRDDRYAKFRVTSANAGSVTFDWAYQPDSTNGQLHARRAGPGAAGGRQAFATLR